MGKGQNRVPACAALWSAFSGCSLMAVLCTFLNWRCKTALGQIPVLHLHTSLLLQDVASYYTGSDTVEQRMPGPVSESTAH